MAHYARLLAMSLAAPSPAELVGADSVRAYVELREKVVAMNVSGMASS